MGTSVERAIMQAAATPRTGVLADARDTAPSAHERKVQAVEAVLRSAFDRSDRLEWADAFLLMVAEECVAAAEAGF